jgi:hypothetical protein
MKRRVRHFLWITVHKWTGIGIGAVVIVWVVSTFALLLDHESSVSPPAPEQLSTLVISPAEAIRRSALPEDTATVTGLSLQPLGDRVVWRVQRRGRLAVLVDGETGDSVAITSDRAAVVARRATSAEVTSVTFQETHSADYPAGRIPVYRVDLTDGQSAFVSTGDGSVVVRHRGFWSRTRIGDLHTFDPMRLLPRGNEIRVGSLLLTGAISLVLAVTGFVLWYLRLRPLRRRSSVP